MNILRHTSRPDRQFVLVGFICILGMMLGLPGECLPDARLYDEKPLWEIGLLGGMARLPLYPGSDEYKTYVLPVPYLIYRGKFLHADREGIRGIFLKTRHFETSISVFGNPPVGSESRAREGMPDLDGIVEMGPSLKWFITKVSSPDRLYFRAAVRGAVSSDFDNGISLGYEGLHANMGFIYKNYTLFAPYDTSFTVNTSIHFQDQDLNGYFYDVSQEHVRPGRPFYESDGGYAGLSFTASVQKRINNRLSLWSYVRWDNIDGAAFEDSPLVKQKDNMVLGLGIMWRVFESKRIAESDSE